MRAALEGFALFGLSDTGAVLEEAASVAFDRLPVNEAERIELQLNERYRELIPSDRTIAEAFEVKLFSAPSDFERPT